MPLWGVPEGHSTIARRFNAGEARKSALLPKGRLRRVLVFNPDSSAHRLALLCRTPGVETLVITHILCAPRLPLLLRTSSNPAVVACL
jgi:hypothetical protein